MPVNANNENIIVSQDIQNSDTSILEYYMQTDDICNEMDKMALSQEFQDYLQKNGINKDDYELKLVDSSSDVPVKVIIHTPTRELHYSITNVTTDSCSIIANENQLLLSAAWNKFTVANRCGSTLARVYVAYFETVGYKGVAVPVNIRDSVRFNLANGAVLNYNPSSQFNRFSIVIHKNKPTPTSMRADAQMIYKELGKWHVAYVKKDKNMYIQLE
ncbi:MAG: hypothetical protein PHY59_00730 [Methanobacterium sp.]|nr:hypothetical protein [Methanobacterium sp.]